MLLTGLARLRLATSLAPGPLMALQYAYSRRRGPERTT